LSGLSCFFSLIHLITEHGCQKKRLENGANGIERIYFVIWRLYGVFFFPTMLNHGKTWKGDDFIIFILNFLSDDIWTVERGESRSRKRQCGGVGGRTLFQREYALLDIFNFV
jgi:hypothetical protein